MSYQVSGASMWWAIFSFFAQMGLENAPLTIESLLITGCGYMQVHKLEQNG